MTHRLVQPVYPHDTDYGGIVSHRAIVTWLEMARISFVRSQGLELGDMWQAGFDLPVVELRVKFLRMVPFRGEVVILTRLIHFRAPRISWDYQIYSADETILHCTAQSDHALLEVARGKPSRRFPEAFAAALHPLLVKVENLT